MRTYNQWDRKKIWNQEINSLLRENDVVLREIYKSNSGKYVEAGIQKYMSANEFVTLCQQAEIKLEVKSLYQIWNLSIEDQVDEILSDRHVRMNYPEFLEAVC